MRLSTLIMNGYFKSRKYPYYNLRSDLHLENSNMHTVHFRIESIVVAGVKSWKLTLDHIKIFKKFVPECHMFVLVDIARLVSTHFKKVLLINNSWLKSSVSLYFISFYFAFFFNCIFLCMCVCVFERLYVTYLNIKIRIIMKLV